MGIRLFLKKIVIYALLSFSLIACGGAPAPSADQVGTALAGAGVTNIQDGEVAAPVPHSFTAHRSFEVAGKKGQFFICGTKRDCDAIFAYFDALKALAGPYLYQSSAGTVVVQLNSGLAPEEAKRVADVVAALP